jgi:hypothetical protein
MTRGRPFEPGNKFGRGRPKGSRNKKNPQAEKIFEDNAPAIVTQGIINSRNDPAMLRKLVGHALPHRKQPPVKIRSMPVKTLEDLNRASEVIVQSALAGKISPSEAQELCAVLDARRRFIVDLGLEGRLRVMEDTLAANESSIAA